MKEFLHDWGLSLCLAGIATALIYCILPEGGIGKPVQIAVSVLWLLCVFSPLVTVDWTAALADLPTPLSETGQRELMQKRLIGDLEGPMAESVDQQGKEALAVYNLSAEKILAEMDIDGDGRIYISRIVAELTEKQSVRRLEIKEILFRRFGAQVEIREVG